MSAIAEHRAVSSSNSAPSRAALRRTRARTVDRVMTGVLWGVTAALVGVLAYFILFTISRGLSVINWTFITQADLTGDYDGPEVFNTFYILTLALLVAVPIGIAAAVYLREYAQQNAFTNLVRFATETLAGVPSLVIGFFGFLIFVVNHENGGLGWGYSRIAGAMTLAILNLPLLLRVSEDAIRNVPHDIREASAALGATKSQTIRRVLLPTAIPQLATGVILTAGKMIGETAAIIFTTGLVSPPVGWFSLNPFITGDTLTVHLYELQAEGVQRNALQVESGTAALLILFLLLFNLGFRGLAALLNRRFAGRTR
ncbi:MAG TPA: phosphate ABC transporter permease PstA [Ktedonobacterales bacterium]